MKRLFTEPLAHFFLIGAILFGVYAWLNRDAADEPSVVRLTESEVEWLVEMWSRQWHRPPDDQELRVLAWDYVKELLLAQEARELGLDDNDTIVRKRLAQKMQFLLSDVTRASEPDESELRALYESNATRYRSPSEFTFVQIYFKTKESAQSALEMIDATSTDQLGDPSILQRDFLDAAESTIASVLGEEFLTNIKDLEIGRWHGPIASTYGFHIVQIESRRDGGALPFETVRGEVLEDWRRLQQERTDAALLASLMKKYEIVVDERVQTMIGPWEGVAP